MWCVIPKFINMSIINICIIHVISFLHITISLSSLTSSVLLKKVHTSSFAEVW